MTPFMLYIWQILNSICVILGVFATVSLLAVLVTLIMIGEDYLKTYRPTIIFTTLTIFFSLASALTPNHQTSSYNFRSADVARAGTEYERRQDPRKTH